VTAVAVVVGGGGLVITVVCVCERLDEQTPPITMQISMGMTTNNTKAVTDTPTAIPTTATVNMQRERSEQNLSDRNNDYKKDEKCYVGS